MRLYTNWFGGGVIGAMFPKLGYELSFSVPVVGWMLFSFRVGQILIFLYTRNEQRWQYKLWPMLLGQVVAGLGMALAATAHTVPVFAVSFGAVGLCAGMTYVNSLFYSLHGRQEDRGRTSGFHEAVLGGGTLLGPLVGGLAAQYYDLHMPFSIGAGVFGLACVVQLLVITAAARRRKISVDQHA